ncbi:hypothetical protein GQ44DRAFT_723005 [Phaeosphaeriaceae sp. PMI808]|nr:hypothetical protein GQ44DRAFT_723005 [Phaeosphaeriaceae sp. PMI808]
MAGTNTPVLPSSTGAAVRKIRPLKGGKTKTLVGDSAEFLKKIEKARAHGLDSLKREIEKIVLRFPKDDPLTRETRIAKCWEEFAWINSLPHDGTLDRYTKEIKSSLEELSYVHKAPANATGDFRLQAFRGFVQEKLDAILGPNVSNVSLTATTPLQPTPNPATTSKPTATSEPSEAPSESEPAVRPPLKALRSRKSKGKGVDTSEFIAPAYVPDVEKLRLEAVKAAAASKYQVERSRSRQKIEENLQNLVTTLSDKDKLKRLDVKHLAAALEAEAFDDAWTNDEDDYDMEEYEAICTKIEDDFDLWCLLWGTDEGDEAEAEFEELFTRLDGRILEAGVPKDQAPPLSDLDNELLQEAGYYDDAADSVVDSEEGDFYGDNDASSGISQFFDNAFDQRSDVSRNWVDNDMSAQDWEDAFRADDAVSNQGSDNFFNDLYGEDVAENSNSDRNKLPVYEENVDGSHQLGEDISGGAGNADHMDTSANDEVLADGGNGSVAPSQPSQPSQAVPVDNGDIELGDFNFGDIEFGDYDELEMELFGFSPAQTFQAGNTAAEVDQISQLTSEFAGNSTFNPFQSFPDTNQTTADPQSFLELDPFDPMNPFSPFPNFPDFTLDSTGVFPPPQAQSWPAQSLLTAQPDQMPQDLPAVEDNFEMDVDESVQVTQQAPANTGNSLPVADTDAEMEEPEETRPHEEPAAPSPAPSESKGKEPMLDLPPQQPTSFSFNTSGLNLETPAAAPPSQPGPIFSFGGIAMPEVPKDSMKLQPALAFSFADTANLSPLITEPAKLQQPLEATVATPQPVQENKAGPSDIAPLPEKEAEDVTVQGESAEKAPEAAEEPQHPAVDHSDMTTAQVKMVMEDVAVKYQDLVHRMDEILAKLQESGLEQNQQVMVGLASGLKNDVANFGQISDQQVREKLAGTSGMATVPEEVQTDNATEALGVATVPKKTATVDAGTQTIEIAAVEEKASEMAEAPKEVQTVDVASQTTEVAQVEEPFSMFAVPKKTPATTGDLITDEFLEGFSNLSVSDDVAATESEPKKQRSNLWSNPIKAARVVRSRREHFERLKVRIQKFHDFYYRDGTKYIPDDVCEEVETLLDEYFHARNKANLVNLASLRDINKRTHVLRWKIHFFRAKAALERTYDEFYSESFASLAQDLASLANRRTPRRVKTELLGYFKNYLTFRIGRHLRLERCARRRLRREPSLGPNFILTMNGYLENSYETLDYDHQQFGLPMPSLPLDIYDEEL